MVCGASDFGLGNSRALGFRDLEAEGLALGLRGLGHQYRGYLRRFLELGVHVFLGGGGPYNEDYISL